MKAFLIDFAFSPFPWVPLALVAILLSAHHHNQACRAAGGISGLGACASPLTGA